MSSVFLISDAARKVQVEAHVLRYWEDELALPIKRNELGHRYYTEEDIKRFQDIKELKERGLQLKAIKMVLKNGKLDVIGIHTKEEQQETGGESSRAEHMELEEKSLEKAKAGYTEAGREEEGQEEGVRAETEQLREKRTKVAEEAKTGQTEVGREAVTPKEIVQAEPELVERADEEYVGENTLMHPAQQLMQEESREEKAARLQWLLKQLFRETLQENNRQLCDEVKESLLKELDYQFRAQEEREEEREQKRAKRDEEHFKRIDELLRKKRNLLKK